MLLVAYLHTYPHTPSYLICRAVRKMAERPERNGEGWFGCLWLSGWFCGFIWVSCHLTSKVWELEVMFREESGILMLCCECRCVGGVKDVVV